MIKRFAAALAAFLLAASTAHADPVRILAAFTFKQSLDQVIAAYKADSGAEVMAVYGPTPALAKQIENAAPGDIFLSADPMWMKYLQDRGLVQPATTINLLATDLVVVARADNAAAPTGAVMGRDYPLLELIGDGRIAMCNPAEHPAGRFGPRRIGRPWPLASRRCQARDRGRARRPRSLLWRAAKRRPAWCSRPMPRASMA